MKPVKKSGANRENQRFWRLPRLDRLHIYIKKKIQSNSHTVFADNTKSVFVISHSKLSKKSSLLEIELETRYVREGEKVQIINKRMGFVCFLEEREHELEERQDGTFNLISTIKIV